MVDDTVIVYDKGVAFNDGDFCSRITIETLMYDGPKTLDQACKENDLFYIKHRLVCVDSPEFSRTFTDGIDTSDMHGTQKHVRDTKDQQSLKMTHYLSNLREVRSADFFSES